MSNDCSTLNNEKNEELSQNKMNSPRIDIHTLFKINSIHDLRNKNNNSFVIRKALINQNLESINEKEILNINKENESNNNMLDKFQKIKIKKINLPKIKDKYANAILFKDRISKYNRILYRNRSSIINKKNFINEDNINNMKKIQNILKIYDFSKNLL